MRRPIPHGRPSANPHAFGDDYGGDDDSESMLQFLSKGNLPISPESGGIHLFVMPTKAHRNMLSDFFNKQRGKVILAPDTMNGKKQIPHEVC